MIQITKKTTQTSFFQKH